MKDVWINNPWFVQIGGGIVSSLVVGLLLNWIASKARKKSKKQPATIRLIQAIGHLLVLPFFLVAFILATPLFAVLYVTESMGACKFTPTCKKYLIQAIEIYGLIGGTYLGVKRFLRCTPSNKRVHDPVPPRVE
jgi:putative component of membrane protein insertase Oxa1/YidC/SpoIIIJ protein YidD